MNHPTMELPHKRNWVVAGQVFKSNEYPEALSYAVRRSANSRNAVVLWLGERETYPDETVQTWTAKSVVTVAWLEES